MKNATTFLSISFTYDFSIDGGAIGTVKTGLQFTQGTIVGGFLGLCTIGFSAGCNISIGTAAQPSSLLAPVAPPVAANTFIGGLQQILMDNTLDILFEISVAPITSGRALFYFSIALPE